MGTTTNEMTNTEAAAWHFLIHARAASKMLTAERSAEYVGTRLLLDAFCIQPRPTLASATNSPRITNSMAYQAELYVDHGIAAGYDPIPTSAWAEAIR
jgi:hypothetical protein